MSLGSPWSEIVLVIGAFFLGGVPFGWIFARLVKGVDLRRVGSGGTGATNCSRLWHGPTSLLVFMLIFGLDFGKGLLGALISEDIARLLAGGLGADPNVMTLQAACGLAAILGHIFSPFLGWLGVFLTGSDTSSNALFAALQATALLQDNVVKHLEGKTIRKEIYVPGRLVNLVAT